MSKEIEVQDASKQFYAALNAMLNGDAGPLTEIWSHDPSVTTLHPIGGREVGWDEVRKSWEGVAQLSTDGRVELKDQILRISGDTAYEVGVEKAEFKLAGETVTGQARVTNIYQRQGGSWKITHHHTDALPVMVDILNRLK